MPRATRTLLAVATTVGLLSPLAQATTAGAEPAPIARKAPAGEQATPYALRSYGFATSVKGGDLPVTAAPLASQALACTNVAGRSNENHLAEINLPGLGTVSGARTDVWTTHDGDDVSSWSRHTLGGVTLSDSPLGTLKVGAITATAHAFHDATGFHAETDTKLASLSFKPPAGPAMELPIPAPSQPVVIPGVAKVSLATSWTKQHNDRGARAIANGLKIELIPTGTVVRVAHARAEIFPGVKRGIFHGLSTGITGNLLGGTITLGKLPLSKMPCQGTDGKVLTKKLLGGHAQDQLTASGVYNQQMTKQGPKKSWGYERSVVGSLDLGGALKIDGIVGQVNVSRSGSKLVTNTKGSRLGSITVNGERQDFPEMQPIEIPGIAKIEPNVVTKFKNGIQVVALRITLLDGTGGTVDLGTAKLRIGKSSR